MCECCINSYYSILFYIFNISPELDNSNTSAYSSYPDFLLKKDNFITDINPIYIRR